MDKTFTAVDEAIKLVPERTYSIGIYFGDSPLNLNGSSNLVNPVISRDSLECEMVNFVADPFIVPYNNQWYMFFEVMPLDSRKGKIALATSPDGSNWRFSQYLIEEEFHLSYPQVFRWKDEFYMVPESNEAGAVRLYKSLKFPYDWIYLNDLLIGQYTDSTLFEFNGKWWMLTCSKPATHDCLELYYANQPIGPWAAHPDNPISRSSLNSRPAGNIVKYDGRLLRFCQDCEEFYGSQVRVYEILKLSISDYEEIELEESPILGAGNEVWNNVSMHHIDAHEIAPGRWIAAVDGREN